MFMKGRTVSQRLTAMCCGEATKQSHPLTRMVLTCWLTHLLPQEQAPMLTVRSGCGIHCCW